jgi:hypothetical protein
VTISANTADITDLHAAARLLTQAHLSSPTCWLLGSSTVTTPDPAIAAYTDILAAALRLGRVDLAHDPDDDGEIVGVACWIYHRAQHDATTRVPVPAASQLARRPPRGGHVRHLLGRLNLLDEVFPVIGGTHHHLACMGTRPGYGARTITELLLHRQHQLADRDGHSVHTEVHTASGRAWLHRRGYQQDGISLVQSTEDRSWAMVRAPHN